MLYQSQNTQKNFSSIKNIEKVTVTKILYCLKILRLEEQG